MLESFHLQSDPAVYTYTREGAATAVSLSPLHLWLNNIIMINVSSCFLTKPFLIQNPFYLKTSNNDRANHKAVMSALEVIGFSKEEINSIYQVLASILLLVSYSMGLK